MELGEIGDGKRSLQYLFDNALESVTENIRDKRTESGDKRKIKIEIIITADGEDRKTANMEFGVNYVLAPIGGGKIRFETMSERVINHPDYMPGQTSMDITREMYQVNEDGEIIDDEGQGV